jgi:hypothetical protein
MTSYAVPAASEEALAFEAEYGLTREDFHTIAGLLHGRARCR